MRQRPSPEIPMPRSFLTACLFLVPVAVAGAADDSPPTVPQDELRAAVKRALPLVAKGAVGHREQRTCFACHNQGLPILAITTAKSRGFEADEEELGRQYKFIAEFLEKNRENYLQGKGQGGQADTAGSALAALELGAWKPDETTKAVTEYLLLYQKESDHWSGASSRPPSEGSPFTTTYVALRGLATFATPEQKERAAERTKQAREWLLKASPKDNEDRVHRLLALQAAAAEHTAIDAAAKDLITRQREDGGWSQLDSVESGEVQSDAYATGSALVALAQAGGMKTDDPAYQRGLKYLLKTQLEDGSWLVHSRSKPFQKYFETGFPHGKDQFISSAATSWAITALALACEKK